jgi:signal transduction histidine kinase/CheY-like chemotaxis protein
VNARITFRDLSVKRKLMLVVASTSGIALFLACTALFTYEIHAFRSALMSELTTLANVIAGNCKAPLTFNDAAKAGEILGALAATPNVDRADLYDSARKSVARYVRPGRDLRTDPGIPTEDRFDAGHLIVARPILLDGEPIGTIRIIATENISARLTRYGMTVVLVLFAAIGVAVVISSKLQHLISGPILQLADAARRVGVDRDYSIRVPTAGADELGMLTGAFNDMLAEVETRDARLRETQGELEQHVQQLQEEVAERQRTQEALQKSEDQLRQAQKMEAIGRLAGGVAHDFNNLLTAVIGYGQLLLADMPDDDPHKADVREMVKAGSNGAALTRQLLAFSRKQILQPQILCLNDIVADGNKILKRLIGEDVTVIARTDPALGFAEADPGQVNQVIMNLAVNARDAMPQGGTLTIETGNVVLDDAFARTHPGAQSGSFVRLTVKDTGCGMTPEVQAQLFEPFFTTKERGKGTGLGLATVYGIVRQSAGYISVESEVGRGSSFHVFLPRVADGRRPGAEEVVTTGLPGDTMQQHTVLLVEDEPAVRALAGRVLSNAGFTVLEAWNASEALRVAAEHRGRIDLLLTDVILPGKSGNELATSLADLRPAMKVLYMSGYTDDAIVRHNVSAGMPLLNKPFKPDDMLDAVRRLIRE